MAFPKFPISRRDSVVMSTMAMLGASSNVASWGGRSDAMEAKPLSRGFGAARRCVLIWLDGGPSHLETFDPKPQAASEVRGPLSSIATRTPGVAFSEGLPKLADRADKFALIRSMTSPVGEHNLATSYALTGHIPGGRAAAPAYMLPVSSMVESSSGLPVHIAVPDFSLGGGSKLQGFLPAEQLPWSLGTEPSQSDYLNQLFRTSESNDQDRLTRRRKLLDGFSEQNASLQLAIDVLSNREKQRAFDIERESPQTLRRYGNKPIGKNCLLARRLLEAGVPLVTVNNKGWDTHDRLHERLHAGYTGATVPVGLVPSLDLAVSALLDDLSSSGLMDETLVVVMGEFGRTPKINSLGGRDHWPRAYSVLLSGAGIRAGTVYGTSDAVGENALDNPVTPSDLVATLYHLLGIVPDERIATPDGQSMTRTPEQSLVVHGVIA